MGEGVSNFSNFLLGKWLSCCKYDTRTERCWMIWSSMYIFYHYLLI